MHLLQQTAGEAAKVAQWKKNLDTLNDAPWTAEVFQQTLTPDRFRRLIRATFASRGMLSEPHLSLAKMPFPHYLTTNYDPCIEEALSAAGRKHRIVRWGDTKDLSNLLINLGTPDSETTVVYLHGRFDERGDGIVMTESSYVARYIASDDARRKLMAIFLTHPVPVRRVLVERSRPCQSHAGGHGAASVQEPMSLRHHELQQALRSRDRTGQDGTEVRRATGLLQPHVERAGRRRLREHVAAARSVVRHAAAHALRARFA